jgi:hypothetical protein
MNEWREIKEIARKNKLKEKVVIRSCRGNDVERRKGI